MPDRIRPLKLESLSEGGSSDDSGQGVTELSIGQDYVDCAGVTLQKLNANTATSDALVRVERSTGALHFVDQVANGTTGLDLSQLLSSVTGSAGAFNALQDIRLWAPMGPGDGFTSGSVKVTTYVSGSPLVASETWFTSAAQTTPLYAQLYTYTTASPLPATITYKLYSAAGVLLRTMLDTLTYATNSPLETSRARTWS